MAVRKEDLKNPDALLAEKHDKRARKDATLNMRVSSGFLEEVKKISKEQGFEKYQVWVCAVLEEAVDKEKSKSN